MLTLSYSHILPVSPFDTAKVEALSQKLSQVKDFSKDVSILCEKLTSGWVNLKEVMSSLGQVLSSPPLFSEEEKWFETSCHKCGAMLDNMSSVLEDLSSRMAHEVVRPLCDKIEKDMVKIQEEKTAYEMSIEEQREALVRFGRQSKKKETDKSRFEGEGDLYLATKKYYHAAVEYYSSLNVFRYSHFNDLTDPILNLVKLQADVLAKVPACFEESGRVVGWAEVHRKRLTRSGQIVSAMVNRQKDMKLSNFPLSYTPDPSPTDPFHDFLPIYQHMDHKSGYAFMRSPRPPLKWELTYLCTQKQSLCVCTDPSEEPEVLIPLLGCVVSRVEIDDRRYTFEVTKGSKSVLLQGLSDRDCDEWLTTVKNLSKLPGDCTDGKAAGRRGTIVEERESFKQWITKELGNMKPSRDGVPHRTFTGRYLGSRALPVADKRHSTLVSALKKAHAKHVHGMILGEKMTIVIRSDGVKCYDGVGKDFFTLPWKKLAYCGYVLENEKLFGFIFPSDDKSKDVCIMFDADHSGKMVWEACQKTIQSTHKMNEIKKKDQKSISRQPPGNSSTSVSSQSDKKATLLKRSDSSQSALSDISDDMNYN